MQQGRWVSYIYRFRDDVKCENAGFIKVQKISKGCKTDVRIQMGLKMFKYNACTCRAYLIFGQSYAKHFTDIYIKAEERDTVLKCINLPWDNPLGDGKPFDLYDGILFVCGDGELLTGMWNDSETTPSLISYDEKKSENVWQESYIEVALTKEQCDSGKTKSAEEKMLTSYPKLPKFVDSPLLDCVKILPQDIGKLAVSNWKLGTNSFLSHAYFRYRYLMLGRVLIDAQEKMVIGIPGVYTNKEKYLANMFGFSKFISVKNTSVMTGKFGYWIFEVLSE